MSKSPENLATSVEDDVKLDQQPKNAEGLGELESIDLGQLVLNSVLEKQVALEKQVEVVDKNTETFIEFLKIDEEIKQLMVDLSSDGSAELRSGYENRYANTLLTGNENLVRKFEELIKRLSQLELAAEVDCEPAKINENQPDLIASALENQLQLIRQQTKESIYGAGLDLSSIKQVYAQNITKMDPTWVKSVSDKMFGWSSYIKSEASQLISKADSYNELLHIAHSYAMSDERLRASFHPWTEVDESKQSYITGFGQKTPAAQDVYRHFMQAWEARDNYQQYGWRHEPPNLVDIVSFDETLQVAVRDYGHALSLVIDDFSVDWQGKLLLKYTFPKVINKDIVQQLPGIAEIRENYARGQLKIDADQIGEEIINFVKKVPTDEDRPSLRNPNHSRATIKTTRDVGVVNLVDLG